MAILVLLAVSACSDESPTSEGSGGATGSATSASTGGGSAGGPAGTGGAACDDSKPDPSTNPAGTCDNLGPVCAPYCKSAVGALKPGVAYTAITCLATETDCDNTGLDCLVQALADSACPDASADDDGDKAAMLCSNAAGGEACHELLDGMIEAARSAVIGCAQQACTGTVEPCVRQVLTPPPM